MPIPVMLAAGASIVGGMRMGEDPESRKAPGFDINRLIELARSIAPNADRFVENPPYFWRSEISSDRVDSYFTRMHETTLRSFAEGADVTGDQRGIAFQYSHDWTRMGLGRSLEGHFEHISGTGTRRKKSTDATKAAKDIDATMRTVVDFYTVPGLKMNAEMGTDDFILAVDSGLAFDVSVGFFAGSVKCSICGGEMVNGWFGVFGYDCNHFPGELYETLDKSGNPTGEMQLCFAWIYDGTLSEVSQVYDGATPSAGHLKAQLWANDNKLDGQRIRTLESLYRAKLPGGAFVMSVPDRAQGDEMAALRVAKTPKKREDTDDAPKIVDVDPNPEDLSDVVIEPTQDPDKPVETDDVAKGTGVEGETTDDETEDERSLLTDLQSVYGARGITLAPTARETIIFLADAVLERSAQIKALEPDAKAGKAYRKTLIATGHRDGAAALGESYDKDLYDGIWKDLAIEKVERMVADFTKRADARFPVGRRTTETAETDNIVSIESARKAGDDNTPDEAFR